MSEKLLNRNIDLMTVAQWVIKTMQWVIKGSTILCLSLVFAVGLLNLAQGAFRVFAYYWLSNEAHRYPLDLAPLFLGLKCTAFFLVTIWLLSQYRDSAACQAIIKRSIRIGLVLGILLTAIVAVERFVINYYTNQINCELPEPPRNLQ
jgi:hypothetical protein